MSKIAVIGIGNILFSDDGAGVYVVKLLEKNVQFSSDVELIDGGTLGFRLLDLLQSFEKVIIIDTISLDDEAGSVFVMPASELCEIASLRQTAHEVEVVEMLQMAELFDSSAEVTIVGIVPKDINTVQFDLSSEVKSGMDLLVQQTLTLLASWDVEYHTANDQTDIEKMLTYYQEEKLA